MKIPKIVKNIAKKVDEEINEVKDPICGMKVNLEKTKYILDLNIDGAIGKVKLVLE